MRENKGKTKASLTMPDILSDVGTVDGCRSWRGGLQVKDSRVTMLLIIAFYVPLNLTVNLQFRSIIHCMLTAWYPDGKTSSFFPVTTFLEVPSTWEYFEQILVTRLCLPPKNKKTGYLKLFKKILVTKTFYSNRHER